MKAPNAILIGSILLALTGLSVFAEGGQAVCEEQQVTSLALDECTPQERAAELDIISGCFQAASSSEPQLGWTGSILCGTVTLMARTCDWVDGNPTPNNPVTCQAVYDRVFASVMSCMEQSGHDFQCYRIGAVYHNGWFDSAIGNHVYFGIFPYDTPPLDAGTVEPIYVVDPWRGITEPVPYSPTSCFGCSYPQLVPGEPPPPPRECGIYPLGFIRSCCDTCLGQGANGFDAYENYLVSWLNRCTCT